MRFAVPCLAAALAIGALSAVVAAPPTPVSAPGLAVPAPASVDLRPTFKQQGLTTRTQGQRGTCSVFAMTGAIEYAAAVKQGKGTPLSVEFLNWAAHRATRRRADGGFFSEIWRGFEVYGTCPESLLPYRDTYDPWLRPDSASVEGARPLRELGLRFNWIKPWNVRTGLTAEQLTQVKQTLAAGWPVCGGFRWPKQELWTEGVLQMCGPEAVFDGHSVLLVGYRDDARQPGGGVFLIRNSGGPRRDGALPYAYVQAYMNDAAWVGTER